MEQPTLLTRRQAAIKIGVFPTHFNYVISQEAFSSYLIEDNEHGILVSHDVLPVIEKYIKTNQETFHYYEAHPDYLIAYRVAPILNKTNQELIEEIHQGKWDDMVVKVPRVKAPQPPYDKSEKYLYFFLKSKLLEGGRYNTIEQISHKTTMISRERLQVYRKLGLLPQPAHLNGTNLFEESQILELIPKIKEQFQHNVSQHGIEQVRSAFELLNASQQALITQYLQYRDRGGVIDYNGYKSSSSIAKKQHTLETMKSKLAAAFVVIISGRCGIEEDFQKNPFCRYEVPAAYNPDVFDMYSITKEDFFYLSAKRKPTTLIQIFHQLRPFYYYLLENLEEEATESSDLEVFRDFKRVDLRVKNFLKQFPTTKQDINQSDYEQRTKTFLTREQMVLVKQLLLEDIRAVDPIKHATMWQFSCTTGVRPEELPKLEINHFRLNSEGFIEVDEKGWGTLYLPAPVSKQDNSPSHPDFHTPIPPPTVHQLNQYLSRLYKCQGDNNPRGKGFLFRRDYALPFHPYSRMRFKFIERLRHQLDFLDDVRKQDFIFKASRHSLNNTIMRTYITSDKSLNEAKRTASDHQLRHKSSKTVGEEYYLDDITKEQYYEVLDKTINFPWNLEKLIQWELDMGYRKPLDKDQTVEDHILEENAQTQLKLQELEQKLEVLKKKPKQLTEQQWVQKRRSIIREKNMLLAQV